MRRSLATVAALILAVGGVGCGESEEDRVRTAVETLQSGFADSDYAGVCAVLGERAKRQIGTIGHDRVPTTCERDLRDLIAAQKEEPGLRGGEAIDVRTLPQPEIVAVAIDGDEALVSLRLDGAPFDVPLLEENGDWKLDDLFLATGPVRRDLR